MQMQDRLATSVATINPYTAPYKASKRPPGLNGTRIPQLKAVIILALSSLPFIGQVSRMALCDCLSSPGVILGTC